MPRTVVQQGWYWSWFPVLPLLPDNILFHKLTSFFFQERLQQLTKELASVAEQQEQLVGELDIAKEDSDLEKVDRLQSELEQIANKHLQLLTEQNELLRKQRYFGTLF